jgi:CDP-glucose 4,6-dehydratase
MGADIYGLALEPEALKPPSKSLFTELGLAERLGERHRVGDIRDAAVVNAAVAAACPEVVLHLAAQPLVRRSYRDPLGTWSTNVQGSLLLLEALKLSQKPCSVVLVTTDKVYANREWEWGYREDDRLGGHDPYSASKAAMELMVASWRSSFCGSAAHQTPHLALATARAGNVIGGGDWAADRIVPDVMRALASGSAISLRQPGSTRPWQHVLEPLAGYMVLAQKLTEEPHSHCQAYNFGPSIEANRPVYQLVEQLLSRWPNPPGWTDVSDPDAPHEAGLLFLVADRAQQQLRWMPRWDFAQTTERTVNWYRRVHQGETEQTCCLDDLQAYLSCDGY